jgi:hypothetical protein
VAGIIIQAKAVAVWLVPLMIPTMQALLTSLAPRTPPKLLTHYHKHGDAPLAHATLPIVVQGLRFRPESWVSEQTHLLH